MRVGRKEASRKLTKEVKEKLKILKISERWVDNKTTRKITISFITIWTIFVIRKSKVHNRNNDCKNNRHNKNTTWNEKKRLREKSGHWKNWGALRKKNWLKCQNKLLNTGFSSVRPDPVNIRGDNWSYVVHQLCSTISSVPTFAAPLRRQSAPYWNDSPERLFPFLNLFENETMLLSERRSSKSWPIGPHLMPLL
jgi:hypothetical protein